jgi:RNA polymerase sigma-70 factor, ECF subfamily
MTDADTDPRDQERFGAMVAPELARLRARARRMVGQEADDAVQDCMERALRGFGGLRDPCAAPAWLTTILVNCCHDRGRRRARTPLESCPFEELEPAPGALHAPAASAYPADVVLELDVGPGLTRSEVREELAGMPTIYRVPLYLVHMEGWATADVARLIDRPVGTVLARLHRGRALLRARLLERC